MSDEFPVYATPAIQTLYRVYRPTTFDADELVGQEHVSRTLQSALRQGRLAHAYLFCGPRGTGKTSTARLLAKAANCLHPDPDHRPCNECAHCRAIVEGRTLDIVEIDAASNRGIDEIRALRETVQIAPAQLKYRFYIIDECHQLTPAAWNAFLKTLEEPPPHAKFVLCTTEPEKLLDTVASRCQRFDFHRIGVSAIVAHMRAICDKEGLAATDEALEVIARQATGSMRDALSLLETLAAYGTSGEGITLDTVHGVLGAGSDARVLGIVDALAANDIGAGIAAVNAAAEAGVEPGVLAGQIVAALRALLYAAYGVPGGAGDLADAPLRERLPHFAPPELAFMTKLFSQTEFRLKHTAYGHLPLELAVVDAVLMRTGQSPAMTLPQTIAVQPAAPTMPTSVPPPAAAAATPTPARAASPPRPPRPTGTPSVAPGPAGDEMSSMAPRPERFRRDRAEVPALSASPPPIAPPAPSITPAIPAIPETPPAAADGAAVMSLEQLDGLWTRIKQHVRMEGGHSMTFGVLSDVSPFDVRGDLVVLATHSEFHCKHINEDETRLFLEQIVGEVIGQPVRVTCELHRGGGGGESGSARTARPPRGPRPTATPAMPPFAPPTPTRASAASASSVPPSVPAPPVAPPPEPTGARDGRRLQRMGNLLDAQILDPEDAPPFPDAE